MQRKWKVKIFLCFVIIFGLLPHCQFQVNAKESILFLNSKNSPLKEILSQIEKQSEYFFIYKSNEIDINQPITIELKGLTIDQVLIQLFNEKNIDFSIHNRQIILTKHIGTDRNLEKNTIKVSGTITDIKGEPLIGASVRDKTTSLSSISDINGKFSIILPNKKTKIEVKYLGFETKEYIVDNNEYLTIKLAESISAMQEIIVVGYGIQKKESLVGAISQTTGETLMKAGGVPNLALSLTGQLPGLTTLQSSGQPGHDNPLIFIRGQSTWNGSQPLIMVDGVERNMNDIDVSEVASVSILKDASSTAVFGVKGADGVVLITTKRGAIGKPIFKISANSSAKTVSKLSNTLNSYNTLLLRNKSIEHEISSYPGSWSSYNTDNFIENYNPQNPNRENLQWMYPDVNWNDVLIKDWGMSQRINFNVAGGTEFVKYFGSISYTHDGDLMNSTYNSTYKYSPGFTYDRLNFRTNLDFQLTSTTQFGVNLAGYLGNQKSVGQTGDYLQRLLFTANLRNPVDVMVPQYSDGLYGFSPSWSDLNPLAVLNSTGVVINNRTQVSSDFIFKQDLSFITRGLTFRATLAYDNYFSSTGNNINNGNSNTAFQMKRIRPDGVTEYLQTSSINGYQYVVQPRSINVAETVTSSDIDSLQQALVYDLSLNYNQRLNKHDIGLLALFKRRENSTGAVFPNYREDWVGRITYNYDSRYLCEINGAYNGSEKFGPGYRFGFFPSLALGWIVSNESFVQLDWLDKLKIRGSIGKVGSDAGIPRWSYLSDYTYGGNLSMGYPVNGIYPNTIYKESVIANPNLHWETALKRNLGIEVSVLKNLFSVNVDIFHDNRDGIFMSGDQRSTIDFFGQSPSPLNIGQTETNGFEIELRMNKQFTKKLYVWAFFNMAHSVDKIIYAEDPELLAAYQKKAGFQIGQNKMQYFNGVMQNWDDVYSSVSTTSNLNYRLPGEYNTVDYNADGKIDQYDVVPVGYPTRPQNTYSYSIGADYKDWSFMLQFYAVNNVSQSVQKTTWISNGDIAYERDLAYWTKENGSNTEAAPRYMSPFGHSYANLYDASYVRLKTAEISYTFKKDKLKFFGLTSMKLFLNGYNLFLWSKLPEDKEGYNIDAGLSNTQYPMFKQFNIGFNITL